MALPTLNSMIGLYASGMELVLESKAFLRQVEELKRLSLNAEIQANHSGDDGVVFQTIARALGTVARDAKIILGELMSAAKTVSQGAIASAALARICEKYQAACAVGIRGNSEALLRQRLERDGTLMLARIAEIRRSLGQASSALADIERLGIQLPMIATLLRIEAHRPEQVHQALAANAMELMELRATLAELLGTVQRRTTSTLSVLRALA